MRRLSGEGRRIVTRTVAACLLLAACLGLPAGVGAAPAAGRERWIVQLAPGTDPQRVLEPARQRLGVRHSHVFRNAIRGFAAELTAGQRRALLRDPRVVGMAPDLPIRATFEPQAVQPGVKRVRAPANPDRADPPLDVDIAVLDTGIQPDHPDLNVAGGYNCTSPGQSESARQGAGAWRDGGVGHGTHVAGIVAARDNGQGVAGVAAGARLWSVKVLDHDGLGYWSWIICGLDWVASKADPSNPGRPLIEVANMSLAGGGTDDGACGFDNFDPLHRAVCRVDRAGVTIVAAAGNEATSASGWVPAAYDEVISVSALADYDGQPGGLGTRPASSCAGQDDAFAPFSNHGPDVDVIAPGVCILSTLPGSAYGRMSGTSMATPHAAGAAALFHLWEERHGRPEPRPQAVRSALIATGALDWRTGTDADRNVAGSHREPLIDAASFSLEPTFRIAVTPPTRHVTAGATVTYDVAIARLGGFGGSVGFDVSGLPAGSGWSIGPDPLGVDGSGWRRISIDLPPSAAAATHVLAIEAGSGSVERSVQVRLHVDGVSAPGTGGPRLQLRSGVATKLVALPGRVAWNSIAGATAYQLQASRDGGPWTSVPLPTSQATQVDRTLWPGSTYRHRVRAMTSGAWGGWLLGQASVPVPGYAPWDGVALSGTWTRAPSVNAYSELPMYSKQAGATATIIFEGRSVSWIATRGPTRGKARILLDGVVVATVDLQASSTQYRRVVFGKSWANAGRHTLQIRVLGTSGRPRVDVDALVVIRDR